MRRRIAIPVAVTAVLLAAGTTAVWTAVSSPATVAPEVVVGDPATTMAAGPVKPINEVGDPGAEFGWSSVLSAPGSFLVRDESKAHSGLASFKLVVGPGGGDAVMDDSPNWVAASTGPTCTTSAWVAGPIGATIQLALTEYVGGVAAATTQTPITLADTDWHLIETTLAVTPGNAVDLRIFSAGLAAGSELWVDDVTQNCGKVIVLQAPIAALTVAPASGVTPVAVTADASASTDVDGDIATYAFNWGDGSPVESTTTPAAAHTYAAVGTFVVTVTITDAAGLTATATQSIVTSGPPNLDPVIVAAGDIACANGVMSKSCASDRTAKLIASIAPTRVFPLGDLQYGPTRTAAEFQSGYGPYPDPIAHPSWGDFKAITSPTIGSHEYDGFPTADGYFEYFNGSPTADGPAGKPDQGYYAETIGTWRVLHLNSQKGYQAGAAQDKWLAAEMAANPTKCSLITWHHPRFSSGVHGDQARVNGLFATAYAGGADVLMSGNDHLYERFGPQNPTGSADAARGVVQFVVGSGGRSLYNWGSIKANSAFRDNTTYGVLSMTLHDGSYDWAYIAEDGTTLDSGTTNCTA